MYCIISKKELVGTVLVIIDSRGYIRKLIMKRSNTKAKNLFIKLAGTFIGFFFGSFNLGIIFGLIVVI